MIMVSSEQCTTRCGFEHHRRFQRPVDWTMQRTLSDCLVAAQSRRRFCWCGIQMDPPFLHGAAFSSCCRTILFRRTRTPEARYAFRFVCPARRCSDSQYFRGQMDWREAVTCQEARPQSTAQSYLSEQLLCKRTTREFASGVRSRVHWKNRDLVIERAQCQALRHSSSSPPPQA